MKHLDIIVLNYKNWPDTLDCLESIKAVPLKSIRIVLVEICNINNSRSKLSNYLRDYPLSVKFITTDENKGFAYANNLGIKAIMNLPETEFIWLLNNDTRILPDTPHRLFDLHQTISHVETPGFIGAKILHADKPDTIQTIGGNFSPKTGISRLIGKDKADRRFDSDRLEVDYVIGASMFFHKSLIKTVGLMPEDYFLYYEDIDWCLTAKEAGPKNYTALRAVVFHKQGGSTQNKYTKKQSPNPGLKKFMYSSYIRLFKKKFPEHIRRARLMLLKQSIGRLIRLQIKEAILIMKVLISE